jgi:hypothetical protein
VARYHARPDVADLDGGGAAGQLHANLFMQVGALLTRSVEVEAVASSTGLIHEFMRTKESSSGSGSGRGSGQHHQQRITGAVDRGGKRGFKGKQQQQGRGGTQGDKDGDGYRDGEADSVWFAQQILLESQKTFANGEMLEEEEVGEEVRAARARARASGGSPRQPTPGSNTAPTRRLQSRGAFDDGKLVVALASPMVALASPRVVMGEEQQGREEEEEQQHIIKVGGEGQRGSADAAVVADDAAVLASESGNQQAQQQGVKEERRETRKEARRQVGEQAQQAQQDRRTVVRGREEAAVGIQRKVRGALARRAARRKRGQLELLSPLEQAGVRQAQKRETRRAEAEERRKEQQRRHAHSRRQYQHRSQQSKQSEQGVGSGASRERRWSVDGLDPTDMPSAVLPLSVLQQEYRRGRRGSFLMSGTQPVSFLTQIEHTHQAFTPLVSKAEKKRRLVMLSKMRWATKGVTWIALTFESVREARRRMAILMCKTWDPQRRCAAMLYTPAMMRLLWERRHGSMGEADRAEEDKELLLKVPPAIRAFLPHRRWSSKQRWLLRRVQHHWEQRKLRQLVGDLAREQLTIVPSGGGGLVSALQIGGIGAAMGGVMGGGISAPGGKDSMLAKRLELARGMRKGVCALPEMDTIVDEAHYLNEWIRGRDDHLRGRLCAIRLKTHAHLLSCGEGELRRLGCEWALPDAALDGRLAEAMVAEGRRRGVGKQVEAVVMMEAKEARMVEEAAKRTKGGGLSKQTFASAAGKGREGGEVGGEGREEGYGTEPASVVEDPRRQSAVELEVTKRAGHVERASVRMGGDPTGMVGYREAMEAGKRNAAQQVRMDSLLREALVTQARQDRETVLMGLAHAANESTGPSRHLDLTLVPRQEEGGGTEPCPLDPFCASRRRARAERVALEEVEGVLGRTGAPAGHTMHGHCPLATELPGMLVAAEVEGRVQRKAKADQAKKAAHVAREKAAGDKRTAVASTVAGGREKRQFVREAAEQQRETKELQQQAMRGRVQEERERRASKKRGRDAAVSFSGAIMTMARESAATNRRADVESEQEYTEWRVGMRKQQWERERSSAVRASDAKMIKRRGEARDHRQGLQEQEERRRVVQAAGARAAISQRKREEAIKTMVGDAHSQAVAAGRRASHGSVSAAGRVGATAAGAAGAGAAGAAGAAGLSIGRGVMVTKSDVDSARGGAVRGGSAGSGQCSYGAYTAGAHSVSHAHQIMTEDVAAVAAHRRPPSTTSTNLPPQLAPSFAPSLCPLRSRTTGSRGGGGSGEASHDWGDSAADGWAEEEGGGRPPNDEWGGRLSEYGEAKMQQEQQQRVPVRPLGVKGSHVEGGHRRRARGLAGGRGGSTA